MRKTRTLEVPLQPEELGALYRLAERERRDQAAQAAWIVRCELEKRGLLPAKASPGASWRAQKDAENVGGVS